MRTRKISLTYVAALCVLLAAYSLASLASEEASKLTAEYPASSPDGTKLVYVSNETGSRDLWIASVNGANATLLTPWPDSDERHPDWAPNGNRIVFSSTRGATKHNIWTINPDGSNATQLTSDDAEHEHPRFSPNGSSILYTSNSTGKRELWVMNADGSNQRSLALIGRLISDPDWAPDGSKIVYVGCRRAGACNLFLINANGSGGSEVTTGDFQDWNPAWGTPGILFASNRGGGHALWLVQPDGSGLQQVTSPDGVGDLDPHWLGNTNGFVFSRSGKGVADAASDIWSVASLGGAAQQLTTVGEPLSIKQRVLSELISLRASVTDATDRQKLDEAIAHLGKAVNSSLWIDSSHLQPRGGETVFTEEKNAVNKLRILVKEKKSNINEATLRGLIARLVMADRLLVEVVITEAVEGGVDSKDSAKARQQIEEGDTAAAADDPINAIEYYRNAWKHMLKS
jgi:dipeptidyl aminopeptidase/acylaminoacyl peptidase